MKLVQLSSIGKKKKAKLQNDKTWDSISARVEKINIQNSLSNENFSIFLGPSPDLCRLADCKESKRCVLNLSQVGMFQGNGTEK